MFTSTAEFPAAGVARAPRFAIRMPRALILVALAAVMTFTVRATRAADDRAISVGALTDFHLRPSHGGLYRGEVAEATVRIGESNQWVVRLADRGHRRLAHANIGVRVWMPETGVESPNRPAATYVGDGRYRLDGVRFPRGGWWNVALVVDGRAGVDSLAFNVRIP